MKGSLSLTVAVFYICDLSLNLTTGRNLTLHVNKDKLSSKPNIDLNDLKSKKWTVVLDGAQLIKGESLFFFNND